MRALIFILLFTIASFCSCKPKSTEFSQTFIHFESVKEPSISKIEAAKSDSCILRFHTGFNNDTVWVGSSNTNPKFIVASTNYSTTYATSLAIKKDLKTQIEIKILGAIFSFVPLKDYLFIDIYYDNKAKKLDVYYSNNILVLS